MAKQKSILPISGKLGTAVFVDGKQGSSVRTAPEAGSKKDEPALKKQYSRTQYLNNLAGGINSVVDAYAGTLKVSNFYNLLNKRFRKEPLNNRFLLLKQLEGMEVNTRYALHKLSDAKVTVSVNRDKMIVEVEVLYHPASSVGRYKVNCYTVEASLLCWTDAKEAPVPARQVSIWISLRDELPCFKFKFDRQPDTVEWLVCLHIQVGFNGERIPAVIGEGMRLISAGTFNEKDIALLAKTKQERVQAERLAAVKTEEQVTRVKPEVKKKR